MTRPLSIFLGLFLIIAVVMLIGAASRTSRFAEVRSGLGRQMRSAMNRSTEEADAAEDA